jgi:hypothetical protein
MGEEKTFGEILLKVLIAGGENSALDTTGIGKAINVVFFQVFQALLLGKAMRNIIGNSELALLTTRNGFWKRQNEQVNLIELVIFGSVSDVPRQGLLALIVFQRSVK